MFGHFDDQLDFGLADGLFVFHELVQEGVEVFLFFDFFEDTKTGAEAVLAAILRDFGLRLDGFRASGFLCVAAIGRDLLGSCHRESQTTRSSAPPSLCGAVVRDESAGGVYGAGSTGERKFWKSGTGEDLKNQATLVVASV